MQPGPGDDVPSRLTSALIADGRARVRRRPAYAESQDDHPGPEPPATAGTEIFGDNYSTLRYFVPDVEASVDRFVRQDSLLREFEIPSPSAVMEDGFVPIDLGLNGLSETRRETVRDIVVGLLERPPSQRPEALRIVATPPKTAENGFRRQLQRFLGLRLYSDDRVQDPAGSLIGYEFEVSTRTDNLRIHYSPAYFINPYLTFGAPTSPVKACLQPGRYIFGAYLPDPGYWSSAEYDVPGPSHHAYLDV